ncbi:unnamed protein product, partial [Didymodactylos carnosus]
MAHSLAWASVERHFILFQKPSKKSLKRQLLKFLLSYLTNIMLTSVFIVLPQCSYIPCIACFNYHPKLVILWCCYSFFIPFAIMIMATFILIYRLYSKQNSLHIRQWKPLKNLTIQIIIYVLWFCITYCPSPLYRVLKTFDPKRYKSSFMSNILVLFTYAGIQTYPILTHILLKSKHRPRKRTTFTNELPILIEKLSGLGVFSLTTHKFCTVVHSHAAPLPHPDRDTILYIVNDNTPSPASLAHFIEIYIFAYSGIFSCIVNENTLSPTNPFENMFSNPYQGYWKQSHQQWPSTDPIVSLYCSVASNYLEKGNLGLSLEYAHSITELRHQWKQDNTGVNDEYIPMLDFVYYGVYSKKFI